ncbi:FAD-dependent oxidoreductase [Streptomyces sp. NBC_00144]|uniref:NAD(P)/FAD-dependent oxidoreductase n=1 Tax=Streptomyces sp. NBC_00144 TaxID=2975665 RepID=UPI00324A771C
MTRTVIVGGGLAGAQTALELRRRGYAGEITLVGSEKDEPYDRPPLSKDFLKGAVERDVLTLLPAKAAVERNIALRLGHGVTHIDRSGGEVVLTDGSVIPYDHLVLATGARNRPLPAPGGSLPGVWSLRGVDEAEGMRRALAEAHDVVIVGGGFIGLEVAAAARARGARVTVVEFQSRVMARVLSPEMSRHFAEEHRRNGVSILTGLAVTEVLAGRHGCAQSVRLSDGSLLSADAVIVGVGVLPSTELAEEAGLETGDGIVVDDQLRTSDPDIYALGDCARFHCGVSGFELRLESVQNAADQARFVAEHIAALNQEPSGDGAPDVSAPVYRALPWFWSEQYEAKLRIAGVVEGEAESIVRGDPVSGSFSVCRFVGDRLAAVESVNQSRDHLAARKILAAGPEHQRRITRDTVADTTTRLKDLLDA